MMIVFLELLNEFVKVWCSESILKLFEDKLTEFSLTLKRTEMREQREGLIGEQEKSSILLSVLFLIGEL